MSLSRASICLIAGLLVTGCFHASSSLAKASQKAAQNADALAEESRALTTGALDALVKAPTNPPTTLAKTLLKKDQQIEGLPVHRIDVDAILAGQTPALVALTNRLNLADTLLEERERLRVEIAQLNSRLVELGTKYEQERNRGILRRIYLSLGFGGSIAGLLALCFFFPPAIAIVGRILGWVVSALPSLASWVGVVSVKAFDATVRGIEKAKTSIGSDSTAALELSLSKSMDSSHKLLVKNRKAAIN